MNNTVGIVRRIDDLGRIVVPKEIRKTLRIRDGDSLEIKVINDNIILKKYSTMEDLGEISLILVEQISNIINKNIIIFDRDKVICDSDQEVVNKNISNDLYNLIEERKVDYIDKKELEIVEGVKIDSHFIFSTIIINGDIVGGVLIYGNEIEDLDKTFLNLIKDIFVKYIEQ